MIPSPEHIDVLLFALHRQAQVAPYSGLPMWRSEQDRENLRVVVREWLIGVGLAPEAER